MNTTNTHFSFICKVALLWLYLTPKSRCFKSSFSMSCISRIKFIDGSTFISIEEINNVLPLPLRGHLWTVSSANLTVVFNIYSKSFASISR